MPYKETIVHGRITTEHLVQLFDGTDSLADAVSEFLREGFLAGDTLLVSVRPLTGTPSPRNSVRAAYESSKPPNRVSSPVETPGTR